MLLYEFLLMGVFRHNLYLPSPPAALYDGIENESANEEERGETTE